MTTQTQKLQKVLITKFKVSPLVIGSLLYELFHSVLIEERQQKQMDIIDKYKVFEKSNTNDFLCNTFMEYVNNNRRWANCGYTPIEMTSDILHKRE